MVPPNFWRLAGIPVGLVGPGTHKIPNSNSHLFRRSEMKRALLLLVILLATASIASAQDDKARSILDRYDAFRPRAKDLAMYRLDWAASLEEARQRAARERRPVLLVIIHAQYGDLYSGHC